MYVKIKNQIIKFQKEIDIFELHYKSDNYFLINLLYSIISIPVFTFLGIILVILNLFLILPNFIFFIHEYLTENIYYKKYKLNKYLKNLDNSKDLLKFQSTIEIFKQLKISPTNSLEKVILNFLEINKTSTTYTIKGNVQCSKYKRRSFEDIFLILKYYNKDLKSKELLIKLLNLLQEQKIAGSYCSQIKKFVYHNHSKTIEISNIETEINNLSMIDIYKILDIKLNIRNQFY